MAIIYEDDSELGMSGIAIAEKRERQRKEREEQQRKDENARYERRKTMTDLELIDDTTLPGRYSESDDNYVYAKLLKMIARQLAIMNTILRSK